ncbi:MAG TPA: cobaltochelatase subunit CobN, partial [Vicinamibacterales bacterium]|nr:cobaltochelatase subunit CobN [Vicinamibacterales bacterium]
MLSAFVLISAITAQVFCHPSAADCAWGPVSRPRIALVGSPDLLWPRIIREYEQRYPQHPAVWSVDPSRTNSPDLVFAYYPTTDQLRPTLQWPARRWLGFPVEFVDAAWKRDVDKDASARASAYLDEGGVENGVRLLAYLYSLVRDSDVAVEPPIKGPQAGIYHPESADVFLDYESYRRWWETREARSQSSANDPRPAPALDQPKPIIAISFFSTSFRGRDLALVDAAIRNLEGRGCVPVAVFGYPLDTVTTLLTSQGVVRPQAVIAVNATLSSPKDANIYDEWGVPVLNGLVTRESLEGWRANAKGLSADRMAAHLSFPERSGLIEPTLVGTTETTDSGFKTTAPFAPGLDELVARAMKLVALRTKPSSAKRVALVYYDNPAGKGNIGASYLQVFPSLRNILAALAGDGYELPEPLPGEPALRRMLEANGRNLELWAEGEKQRLASVAAMVRWPVKEYRRYYDSLPKEFRDAVEETWGTPEHSQLMTADCGSDRCFLLPVERQGNILLAPQPLRTTFEQASDPAHQRITPPPHQYIAFYLWLRHEWNADAVVHVGRHGTLEWLPGKQTALAPEDAPPVLLGDLPNFNIYVMDGGGEAIQAKRRGFATLVSHLTPMIWRTGGRADLEKLHQSFHALMDRGDDVSPELLAEYERVTRSELTRLGLDRQLNLDMEGDFKQMAPALHRFLHDIEDAPVPAGLPIFGESPSEERLIAATGAYLFAAYPQTMHDDVEELIPVWSKQLVAGQEIETNDLAGPIAQIVNRAKEELPSWIQSLRASGPAEIAGLLNALRGARLTSRLLGDPLRKPEALPTGGNLHAVDSARIPTQASWRVGQQMADELLKRYRDSHGLLPKRVSLVLWYGETERQQGAMECMALALLGVRPIWNAQGIVDDLQLIGREELGRDRVDVVFTVSGNYRDGFPDKVQLLDRAVRVAAQAPDGIVDAHDKEIADALEQSGMAALDAVRQSRLRVFSAKPGAYGVGVQYLVEKSDGGDTPDKIASLYTANMGFGYSSEGWGIASTEALRANLRSTEAIQFSRSSNLYGTLDNDDTYQYVGGLRTAIEQISKRAPETYLHNMRQAGAGQMVTLREWLATELNSRQLNPVWIQEMQKSGYAGAREMSQEIEHLYGFQKTAPDHLNPRTWQSVLDVFVKDKYGLGLRKFFESQNPHARQTVLARLLDIDRQGIYQLGAR